MLHQGGLHFERRHVLPAYLEHVVAATGVDVVAIGIAEVFVAALGPGATEGVVRFSRLFQYISADDGPLMWVRSPLPRCR